MADVFSKVLLLSMGLQSKLREASVFVADGVGVALSEKMVLLARTALAKSVITNGRTYLK